MNMADVVFDPKNMDTKFYAGDLHDWAIQGDKCFYINPGKDIGYAHGKHPGEITSYEGTEMTRKQFAEAYPQAGLVL
jgi:hypothetical protein